MGYSFDDAFLSFSLQICINMPPKKSAAVPLRARLPRKAKGSQPPVSETPKTTSKVTKKAAPSQKLKPGRKPAVKSGTGQKGKHVTIEEGPPVVRRGRPSDSIVRQDASYPNPFSSDSSRNSTASLYSKWTGGLPTPYPRSSGAVSHAPDTTSRGFNEALGYKYSPGFGGASGFSGFFAKANTGRQSFGAPSSADGARPKATGRTSSSIAAENVSDFFTKLGSPSAPGFPSFEPGYPYPGNSSSWFSPKQYNAPWMQTPPPPHYSGQTHDTLFGGHLPNIAGFGARSNFQNPTPWSYPPPDDSYSYNLPLDFRATSPADDVEGTTANPENGTAPAAPPVPELGIKESRMTREKSMLVPGGRIIKTTTTVFIPSEGGQQKNEKAKGVPEDKIGIFVTDKDGHIEAEEGGWLQVLNRIEPWEVEALLDQNRMRYRKRNAARYGISKKPVKKKPIGRITRGKSGPVNTVRKPQQEETAAESASNDRTTGSTPTFTLGPNHPINQNPPKAKPPKKALPSPTLKSITARKKSTTLSKRVKPPEPLILRRSRRTSRAPSRYSPAPASDRQKPAANAKPGQSDVSKIRKSKALSSPPFTATPQNKTTSSELNSHLANAARLALNVLNRTSKDLITDLQTLTDAMTHLDEIQQRKTSAPLRADPEVKRRLTAIQGTIQRAFEASIERAVSKAVAIERKKMSGARDALREFQKYYTAMLMLRDLQLKHVYGTKYVVQVDGARQKMQQCLNTAVMEHLTMVDISTEQMEKRRGKAAVEAGERFQEEFWLVAALRHVLGGFDEVFAFEPRVGVETRQNVKTKRLVKGWRKLYGNWTADDWARYEAEKMEDQVALKATKRASLGEMVKSV
ncbi:hypothetical protein CJF31_00002975 [Rutstroemia sp. NJR-2017a BVV2]|nr:hypothetical protein CJF31_00001767 [Rutstroemia sp. NJR-2017a BVV2]PQE18332.1 hypothetical protein CJF31_00002975 [Rutstroemia sp. NJR-2017a BVV2]